MGLLITGIIFILFLKYIQTKDGDTQRAILGSFVVLFIFSLVLNWYLEYMMGWEYGIPGADLQNYFEAAKALSNGVSLSQLGNIKWCFELKISNVGYILYAVFIRLIAFTPTIISIRFSLQMVYLIQIIISLIACDNISEFFEPDNKKNKKILFIILALNTGVMQQSSILMRDMWIVFFVSLLMHECKKRESSILKCIIYIIFATLLRSYTVILTIPIFLWYGLNKKKLAIRGCIVLTVFFLGATSILAILAKNRFGILWDVNHKVSIFRFRIIKAFLYPNPISQVKNMMSGTELNQPIMGGNCAFIYFGLSIWNILVYPFAGYGFITGLKGNKKDELYFWLLNIVNMMILYEIFYSSVSEPRHKLMYIYGIVYFYDLALRKMRLCKRNIIRWILVTLNITIVLLAGGFLWM